MWSRLRAIQQISFETGRIAALGVTMFGLGFRPRGCVDGLVRLRDCGGRKGLVAAMRRYFRHSLSFFFALHETNVVGAVAPRSFTRISLVQGYGASRAASAFNAVMPRFHLHLSNRIGDTPDEDGVDCIDLAEARLLALDGIRSLLSHEVRSGRLDLHGRIDIRDPAGRLYTSIPFRDAIEIKGARP